MSTSPTADHLQLRARSLRTLAVELRHLEVVTLATAAATADTWMGPSPTRCADALRSRRSGLLDQADELVRTAQRFERQAADLVTVADRLAAR